VTKRQAQILEMLRDRKRATVFELSRRFDVTETSIRLDLSEMEGEGLVLRYHGGARIVLSSSFETRLKERTAEKQAIAQRALAYVQEGETLYLDSGTTIMRLARALTQMDDLTIVTNSTALLGYMGSEPDKKIILVGGEYGDDGRCCTGVMTERILADIYVSKVFMGADSIDVESGAVFAHLRNLNYIEKIIRNAKQTILLAESGKFNRIRGMKIVELSDIQVIITDSGLPAEQQQKIRSLGITLDVAEV
jgi:DeoR/GlpR family transcriptional regulator of sugar metabolism